MTNEKLTKSMGNLHIFRGTGSSDVGGMDACSLVVRWGVCKFGSMVVRLLVAWFGCCSVLPCSLAFFVACVFAWRGSNVKNGRAGCHVASFGALI